MEINNNPKINLEQWVELIESGTEIPVITKLNGSSMAPLIRKNKDVVTIFPAPNELKVGQIAVFKIADNTCIAHRIYKIDNDIITTFGDNCVFPDTPIKREQIVGIITEVQRGKLHFKLNNKAQIFYGKLWILFLRKIWFFYKKSRKSAGHLIRKLYPEFHKKQNGRTK